MQHAMRELGVLRDLAQAGAGVAELGERLQSRLGELGPALGELVDPPAWNPVELGHRLRRHFSLAVNRLR